MDNPQAFTMDQLAKAIDETSEIVEIPIAGTIGAGSIERAFCRTVHAAIRGEVEHSNPLDCPHLVDWKCGLTGCQHPCLFAQPEHPLWAQLEGQISRAR